MLTPNDLKKGTKIRVRNEFFDTMVLTDSLKRGIRAVESPSVYGGTEHGSIYADHITHALIDDAWVRVFPTKTMLKNADRRAVMGL